MLKEEKVVFDGMKSCRFTHLIPLNGFALLVMSLTPSSPTKTTLSSFFTHFINKEKVKLFHFFFSELMNGDGMRLNEKEELESKSITNHSGFKEILEFLYGGGNSSISFNSIHSINHKEKLKFSFLIDSIDFLKRN